MADPILEGAMATMLALRFEPLSAERLVFLAPMPDVPGYLNKLCSAVGLGPRARRRLDALIEERVGMAIDDFRLVQMIEFTAPAQLLVVHDRDDRQTPYETAVSLVHGWPGATLLTTEGLGHRRVLEDPDVVAAITRFVASPTEVAVIGPFGAGIAGRTASSARSRSLTSVT